MRVMIRRWKRASACMQRVVRGHIGRQAARRKRVVNTRVAMEGQRMWRGWVVRRWYKTVHAKRTAAATFIKSTWKRRRFRRLLLGQWLSLVRQEKARVEEEARLAAERAAALAKARQLGALTFQRVYRGWKGRRRFTFLRRLYDWTYRREQAVRRARLDLAPGIALTLAFVAQVIKMQKWWRIFFSASKEAHRQRLEAMAEQARQMEEEIARQQALFEAEQSEKMVGGTPCSAGLRVAVPATLTVPRCQLSSNRLEPLCFKAYCCQRRRSASVQQRPSSGVGCSWRTGRL